MSAHQGKLEDLKVLVIDDQKDARKLVRNMLMSMGIAQIYEASNGREGLSFMDIAPEMVDCVMCDWNMPNMTGMELLQQLRTVDPDIPFLMVTGRCDMNSVFEAKSLNVSAYIRKPFSPEQLEAKLRIINQKLSRSAVA